MFRNSLERLEIYFVVRMGQPLAGVYLRVFETLQNLLKCFLMFGSFFMGEAALGKSGWYQSSSVKPQLKCSNQQYFINYILSRPYLPYKNILMVW